MTEMAIRPIEGGVRVEVLVVPNASRSEIVGFHGARVKIRISSPPEKGRANRELASLLKTATGASRAFVASGPGSRYKSVELSDVGADQVEQAIAQGK